MFFTIIGNFCQWRFFPKHPAVTHNDIWAPNTMLSFRKKLTSQSRENLRTDGRMDGKMDKPYFIGPFRLRPAIQQN